MMTDVDRAAEAADDVDRARAWHAICTRALLHLSWHLLPRPCTALYSSSYLLFYYYNKQRVAYYYNTVDWNARSGCNRYVLGMPFWTTVYWVSMVHY